jgi:hypothetical protein
MAMLKAVPGSAQPIVRERIGGLCGDGGALRCVEASRTIVGRPASSERQPVLTAWGGGSAGVA